MGTLEPPFPFSSLFAFDSVGRFLDTMQELRAPVVVLSAGLDGTVAACRRIYRSHKFAHRAEPIRRVLASAHKLDSNITVAPASAIDRLTDQRACTLRL
jgi:hypothetical protein